jgi:hypothetical protein
MDLQRKIVEGKSVLVFCITESDRIICNQICKGYNTLCFLDNKYYYDVKQRYR